MPNIDTQSPLEISPITYYTTVTMWYVYVLRCGDDSLYTGATNDVGRRVTEHQTGRGGRYTRAHLPVQLVAAWHFPDRSAALSAEARFKRLRRARKLRYVEQQLPFLDAPFVAEWANPSAHNESLS